MSVHAKDALELAITSYRYNAAMVNSTLKPSFSNERTLINKFQALSKALINKVQALSEALISLNIAYPTWISKASIDEESLYTFQWTQSC